MKAHLKRLNAPRTWKILRRDKTWIARPKPSGIGIQYSLPLLVVFRDLIGLVHTKKEMKYALQHNEVYVNGKRVKDYKHPVGLFDVISVPKFDLYYRIVFNNGYLDYIEISKDEANLKVAKIVNKKILPKDSSKDGKNIQLNLFDGSNLLTSENVPTHYSVVYTLDKKEIKEILPYQEGMLVYIMRGRNEGKLGKIKKIESDYTFVDVNGYEAKLKKVFIMVIGKEKPVINLVKSEA